MLLRDIHSKLITQYDYKEVCAPSQSQVNTGAGVRLNSQDGVSQKQETSPLSLPSLNLLFQSSFVWDETSTSNVDVVVIPSHHSVTQQILNLWQTFRDLKLMFPGSRRPEQLSLCSQQRIVSTVEDFVLRTEMTGLESQEEDAPNRILFFKPMRCLGQIRSHRRDETWSASL